MNLCFLHIIFNIYLLFNNFEHANILNKLTAKIHKINELHKYYLRISQTEDDALCYSKPQVKHVTEFSHIIQTLFCHKLKRLRINILNCNLHYV